MRRPAPWACAALCSLAACSDARAPDGFSVQDSAGIEIAISAAPAWSAGDAWTVDPEPLVEIGGDDSLPGHALSDVSAVLRLSDGRIVIGDGDSRELRFYAADGTFLFAAGRAGEGPGEMRWLSRVFLLPGDSLLVSDGNLRRLTVFDANGALARTAQLEDAEGAPAPVTLLADGTLLARTSFRFFGGTPTGAYRDTITLVRYGTDGTLLGTAGRHLGTERFVFSDEATHTTTATTLLFGKGSHAAPADRGYWYGSGDDRIVRLHGGDGSLLREVRVARPLQRVEKRHVDEVIRQMGGDGDDDGRYWLRMFAAMPIPQHFPAFTAIIADDDGFLWLRDPSPEPSRTSRDWQVHDRSGRWLGTVTMPDGLEVFRIGADEVLGVWRDGLDVEHVRVHRLRR